MKLRSLYMTRTEVTSRWRRVELIEGAKPATPTGRRLGRSPARRRRRTRGPSRSNAGIGEIGRRHRIGNFVRGMYAPALLALGFGCADGIDPPAPTAVVEIAAGTFQMGRAEGDVCGLFYTEGDAAYLQQNPRLESARVEHTVSVERFCIDEHEVTVRQYDHCQQRGECPAPVLTNAGSIGADGFVRRYYVEPDTYGGYPMLGVDWAQAAEYCRFRGGRLPTEAEWEYVASSRGTRTTQIWSDAALTARVDGDCAERAGDVALGACANGVAPVKASSADVTADGVYDLAGNAAEWVADEFDYFAYCAPTQPGDQGVGALFAVEGRRPVAVPDAAFVVDTDALVPQDNGYGGACITDFEGCADRCGITFGSSASPSTRARRWQVYTCGARFGLSPAAVDACEAAADGCPDDVAGCFDTPPTAPADGGACLRRCQDEAELCITDAAVDGASVVCAQYEANRGCEPTPWCLPRTGWSAEQVHLRPDAFEGDLGDAHTIRGGSFETESACQATPSWRDFRADASPLVGFRCAYDAGTARCR